MLKWDIILTSSVISTGITAIIGTFFKYKYDRKLEVSKNEFEILKNNINQQNVLNQKNIEHFQTINQIVQTKKNEAIEMVWKEHINLRISMSPIIDFFSVLLEEEYLDIIDELVSKDRLNLNSMDEVAVPRGFDSAPLTRLLEEQRPYLEDIVYYKFRSSMLFLLRLRFIYSDIKEQRVIRSWCNDKLLLNHIAVIFSPDLSSQGNIPIEIDSPRQILLVIELIEHELSKTMEGVITGKFSANISLERAKQLTLGFRDK